MEILAQLFNYQFFVNAVIASILSSIICGIAGTYIVTRRIVFISGGITHASFGGIGLAFFLGLSPILGAAVFAVLTALAVQFLSRKDAIRQDSVIGILWSLGMAIGIIFIFLSPGYTPNLMSYLFGSLLTVSSTDLILMAALAVIISFFFIRFLRIILFISFDESYAHTSGIPVDLFSALLMVLVSLTIVLSIRTAGIILVISLLTIPQTTANLFTHDFKKMILYSILFNIIGSFSGLMISFWLNIPSGASIIFSLVLLFGIAKLIVFAGSKRKNDTINLK
jgi:zinc transport system permease protein